MEGLFRVPGPAALLDELRVAFEEGRVLACTIYVTCFGELCLNARIKKCSYKSLALPLIPFILHIIRG